MNDLTRAAKAAEEGAQDYLIKGKVDSNTLARSLRYAIQRTHAEGAEWNSPMLRLAHQHVRSVLQLIALLDKPPCGRSRFSSSPTYFAR